MCSNWIDITLKVDEPLSAGRLADVARWVESRAFFDMKERYSLEGASSECDRTYTITRGATKKVISSDCAAEPADLWALGTIMTLMADEISKERREQQKSKQGLVVTLENYIPLPAPAG